MPLVVKPRAETGYSWYGSEEYTWNVPVTSIAFAGSSVNLNVSFPSTYARLGFEQVIGIPAGAVYRFYKAIGARPSRTYDGALVDCDKRDELPDLVIELGGHKIALTKDEYSFQREVFGRPFCIVNIVVSERVVTIGSLVMRKLDLVFDLETSELGCKWTGQRVTGQFALEKENALTPHSNATSCLNESKRLNCGPEKKTSHLSQSVPNTLDS